MSERQLHRKSRAGAQTALYGNRPPVHIHKLLHQRQAYAAAFVASAASIFNAPEPLKQMVKLLFGDASSGVGNLE